MKKKMRFWGICFLLTGGSMIFRGAWRLFEGRHEHGLLLFCAALMFVIIASAMLKKRM